MKETYKRAKEDKKALEQNMKILEIKKSLYGEMVLETASSYSDIAEMSNGLGENQNAINYLTKARAIYQCLLSKTPSDTNMLENMRNADEKLNEWQKMIEGNEKIHIDRD